VTIISLAGVMGGDERMVATQQLSQLHSSLDQLELEIKRELGGAFSTDDNRLALIQIVAVLNVGIAAYFGNEGSDETTLEWLLVIFALLFGLEMTVWGTLRGWSNAFADAKHPELQASCRLGLVVNLTALTGAVLLVVDRENSLLSNQNARTLSAFTVLLLITSNRKFGQMTLAFGRATTSVIPTVVAIFMVVLIYAVANIDLFGDQVQDPGTGKPYFDTFSRSLATTFRLFTGNWHDTMFQAAEVTTEAAQIWFTVYVFIISGKLPYSA